MPFLRVPTIQGWKSPPPTVEAGNDAVIRDAMQRLNAAAQQDGPPPAGNNEPKRLPQKPKPGDPGWSYTNVGEAEADIVVSPPPCRIRLVYPPPFLTQTPAVLTQPPFMSSLFLSGSRGHAADDRGGRARDGDANTPFLLQPRTPVSPARLFSL